MKYNYKVKRQKFGPINVEVQETNAKKETMVIELYECTNPGGKNSLPHLWYKEGWTETELETYLSMNTYVTDSEGNCRGTEFFVENLCGYPQEQVFDLLSKIVSDQMEIELFTGMTNQLKAGYHRNIL